MDSSSDIPAAGRSTRIRELQGPCPSRLRINKESHKIKKHSPTQQHSQPRKPVIIYMVSPKIIRVSPENFKTLVQRLTGLPSSSSSSSSSSTSNVDQSSNPFNGNNSNGTISSTAALDQGKKHQEGGVDMGGMAGILGVDRGVEMMGSFPGILSPLPTTITPIPPNFFSPPSDPTQLNNFFPDLSPVLHGGTNNHMEAGSFMPSNLVSVPPITYRPPSITPSINYLFKNSRSLGMEGSTFMPRPSSFVSPSMTYPNNSSSCYSFNNSFGMEGRGFMPSPPSFVSPPLLKYPSSTTPSIDQYSFNNSFGMEGSFMQPSPPNFVSPPVLTYASTTPSVSPPILTYPRTPSIDDDDIDENLLNSFFGN